MAPDPTRESVSAASPGQPTARDLVIRRSRWGDTWNSRLSRPSRADSSDGAGGDEGDATRGYWMRSIVDLKISDPREPGRCQIHTRRVQRNLIPGLQSGGYHVHSRRAPSERPT